MRKDFWITAANIHMLEQEQNKSGLINRLLTDYYRDLKKTGKKLALEMPVGERIASNLTPSTPRLGKVCKVCSFPIIGDRCLQRHG